MLEERLLKLLDTEQLSSSKFADVIGVQRSSVSHILSGRNKPSFDFLQKTLKAFPYLNADWLILGEGKMYDTDELSGGGTLFDQNLQSAEPRGADSAMSREQKDDSDGEDTSTFESTGGGDEARLNQNSNNDAFSAQAGTQVSSGSTTDPAGEINSENKGLINSTLGNKNQAREAASPAPSGYETDLASVPKAEGTNRKIARILVLYEDNSFESFEHK